MEQDIKNFESGIDVDFAADKMANAPDADFMRDFFGKVEIAKFLVPYKDKINTIPLLDIKEKGKMLPIFSSYKAFEKSPLPKDRVRVMPFSEIDEIIRKSEGKIAGIIINPHGKSMIFQRNGGNATEKNESGIRLIKPPFVPEKITETLKKFFSECENVYAAYVLWAQKETDLAPKLFLIIDFDGKREEFFPKVAKSLEECMKPGDNIEMAKADFKLLKAAEKLVKPIYKKS